MPPTPASPPRMPFPAASLHALPGAQGSARLAPGTTVPPGTPEQSGQWDCCAGRWVTAGGQMLTAARGVEDGAPALQPHGQEPPEASHTPSARARADPESESGEGSRGVRACGWALGGRAAHRLRDPALHPARAPPGSPRELGCGGSASTDPLTARGACPPPAHRRPATGTRRRPRRARTGT